MSLVLEWVRTASKRSVTARSAAVCLAIAAASSASTPPPIVQSLQLAPAPPRPSTSSVILSLSGDQRSAVVMFRDNASLPRYRSIDIASNRVLEEWSSATRDAVTNRVISGQVRDSELPALVNSPAFRADIARYANASASASMSLDKRFAAGRDRVVFSLGDHLWISDRSGDRAQRLSTTRAAYGPTLSPDGQRVAFTGVLGRVNGQGNYRLHLVDLRGGGRPTLVSSVDDLGSMGYVEWSANGEFVYARAGASRNGGCLVRVRTTAPFTSERLACVEANQRLRSVVYGPNRQWAVLRGEGAADSGAPLHSFQWVDLRAARPATTARITGIVYGITLNDHGALHVFADGPSLTVLDPSTRTARTTTDRTTTLSDDGAVPWLSPSQFVVSDERGVRVEDLQRLRYQTIAWPQS